jgi:hypothetical protein
MGCSQAVRRVIWLVGCAWAGANHLLLDQVKVDDKTNRN